MITDVDLKGLVLPLQEWFGKNARDLPWRREPTPYHVWISEIMLQQTRVEAVKPYYARFLETLPDLQALAECPEDVYLKLWEGLGYYSRVRNLHAAALQVMQEYGGALPEAYEELLKLKGIGHYTAGAISSIAYGRRVPAVDGNVLRVLCRVTGDDTDIMKQSFRNQTESILRDLMQEKEVEPRIFNQALMELGAIVCLPNGEPHCGDCPWQKVCRARAEDRIHELPVKKKAKERRIEERTILILRDGERVAIRKRPAKGLLAGLYELPGHEGHLTEQETLAFVKQMGFSPLRITALPAAKHVFSHVEWHMIGYQLRIEESAFATEEQKARAKAEGLIFVEAEEARQRYAIPSAFAAYSARIMDQ